MFFLSYPAIPSNLIKIITLDGLSTILNVFNTRLSIACSFFSGN